MKSLIAAAAIWLAQDLLAAQSGNPPPNDERTKGVELSVVDDGEILVDATGGNRTGAVYLGNLHLQLTVDAERLLGWSGATLFLNGLGTHGGHPTRLVGDAQGVSSLEAPAGWQLYEAWLQQNLFDNRVSLLAGRYDLNSEFYRLQS